ncbi:MAG: type I pullulanase [Terrimonas sp.]|nr:type I pullulanase [Terrimonas sp.]
MKKTILFLLIMSSMKFSKSQSSAFTNYPIYSGNDLGLVYSKASSQFRIWSPEAEAAQLLLYREGNGGEPISIIDMEKSEGGTWISRIAGDQQGKFYVFRVRIQKKWMDEVPDPYARSVGMNGKRAMVTDLTLTDPTGWDKDISPAFLHPTDAIIYELHIRDASISNSSGITHKGKFLGLAEKGSRYKTGLKTGLDHLKELGVTHIHILPAYDFYSVDESKPDQPQYNWGYDPLNYNTPEGSYSSNPQDGAVRIREFKKMIQTFHKNGLRIVMDVVYNHTMLTEKSYFNQLVPGYYYRQDKKGGFSNATACGNEIASERYMVRKFMLESVLYWVKEYHVDGFRFDLMGVHDIETMNLISEELHAIRPDILIYGEGWTAGASPLPDSLRALKANVSKLDRIAVFSDDIRDGIKGSVFEHEDKGFVSGKPGMEESVKFGIVASCRHPQVDYTKVNYSKSPYAKEPYQTITYCECHDNHVLWDKLKISAPEASTAQRKEMHKLALSIILTAQGISFLHAGTEFLRTKKGVENSFDAPDSINAIDWSLKSKNLDIFKYVKGLIRMRKAHPAFRMMHSDEIRENLHFEEQVPPGVIAFTLNGAAAGDTWKKIFVVYNGGTEPIALPLPSGKWHAKISNNNFTGSKHKSQSTIRVNASSCSVYYQ